MTGASLALAQILRDMTVRYNWSDVTNRPCVVAAEIAALLRMRGTAVTLCRCGASCSAAA